MKKFLTHIILFLAIVFLIDSCYGLACEYLFSHAKSGDTRTNYYINEESTEQILIMGSSRARHHYVPSIIAASTGKTVYNCGTDGYGIVFMYARLLMLTERYTPETIIYDLTPDFDFAEGDNLRYLGEMKKYSDSPCVKDVISLVSPMENIKLHSQLYRYNSCIAKLLFDNLSSPQSFSNDGYVPMYSQMDYDPVETGTNQITTWDPVKKECMDRFVSLCKERGIKLFFVMSPFASGEISPSLCLAQDYANQNGIPLLNYYSDPTFSKHKELFADTSHLNDDGAKQFTSVLCKFLCNYEQ